MRVVLGGSVRVVVVQPYGHTAPAHRALEMEGVGAELLVLTSETGYGRAYAALWQAGRPFIVVEHDVIPWPGAIEGLRTCPEPWCVHEYPLQPHHLAHSFGIGKYRPVGDAPSEWAETPWRALDGAVVPVLRARLGRPCIHTPAVAHARREVP